MREIRTILVPTDFSEVSVVAVQHARALARAFGARVILAHVLEDRLSLIRDGRPRTKGLEKAIEFLRIWADESLERIEARQLGDVPQVEREIAFGVPHVEIVGLTETRNVDLIVMATHGTGLGSRPRRGSATDHVSRHARCPVLVVRDRRTGQRRPRRDVRDPAHPASGREQ